MASTKKAKSTEQNLKLKREHERKRWQQIKQDPIKQEEQTKRDSYSAKWVRKILETKRKGD